MNSKFKDIVDEYVEKGYQDFWYLRREDRHRVISAWLEDRYFGPHYKAYQAWELISELSISDDLPRLVVDIAGGHLSQTSLFEKIVDAIEKDWGHKIAVDYVEAADALAALRDRNWREQRKISLPTNLIDYTNRVCDFVITGGKS